MYVCILIHHILITVTQYGDPSLQPIWMNFLDYKNSNVSNFQDNVKRSMITRTLIQIHKYPEDL